MSTGQAWFADKVDEFDDRCMAMREKLAARLRIWPTASYDKETKELVTPWKWVYVGQNLELHSPTGPEGPSYIIAKHMWEIDREHYLAPASVTSDGSTASYYELPPEATELQHLISHRDMNAQLGEIFRECYRYGIAAHCDKKRGIKKILFYAQAELERLERL